MRKIQESALLVCGGESNESSFEGIVHSYWLIAQFMGWKESGVIMVPGLHGKDAILKTDGLERAEALGQNFS